MKQLIKESLATSISYPAYRKLVSDLLKEGKSTGPTQSDFILSYSILNDARMNRLDKKTTLTDNTIDRLKKIKNKQTWLVITEGWCGDAAQILPIINAMSLVNKNIDFKLVLRDEHVLLMNQFLTNGGMAIPILIILNDDNEVVSSWGPRPLKATKMVADYKEKHGNLDDNFKKELQTWYNKDKGQNIQEDILALLKS